jgi:hypothetical protein
VVNVIDSVDARVFQPWLPTLKDAAQRGPAALAATHYLLYQRVPEYKATFDKANGSK